MSFETILTQQRIDTHTRDGYWTGRTITDYLDEGAAATPDKLAFADSRRAITYAGLRTEVDRCALGLLELGVVPEKIIDTDGYPWPGMRVRVLDPAGPGSASPGSASPGSASPGSASPGSASPGSASPGSASTELPATASGKIQKFRLREIVREGA